MISTVLTIVNIAALVVAWDNPIPTVWWMLLGLLLTDILQLAVLRESVRLYGTRDRTTSFWALVHTAVQFVALAVSVYVFIT